MNALTIAAIVIMAYPVTMRLMAENNNPPRKYPRHR